MKRFCNEMPEEIVEDILLRLPPKSLKSCKCVCKSWYDMIDNPSFITKQLHVSIENNRHSSPVTLCFGWTYQELSVEEVFTGQYKYLGGEYVLSLVTIHKDDNDGGHLPCVIEEINIPFALKGKGHFPPFLTGAHCNGIICFYDLSYYEERVVLCNIELGEFKLLRTPCLSGFQFSGAGFGYDPKANDYKFVKVFSSTGFDMSRAQIYTFGTDSWGEVDLKGICCHLGSVGVYCRGFYYWWNTGSRDSENSVLSFDMSEEKFRSIQLPEKPRRPNTKFWRLTMWNESVAFFISTKRSWLSSSFEMWVMEHNFNGVEGFTYWNKHLTIGPLVCIHSPLAFWKDDELLMQTRDGRIVSYNLHTQNFKELSIAGSVFPRLSRAFSCLKSLVSVKKICLNR